MTGGEDNAPDEVMWDLWRYDEAEAEDHDNGEVKVEDGDSGVIEDKEDGGGRRDDGRGGASEVVPKRIFMGHEISSCHAPGVFVFALPFPLVFSL